MPTTVDTLAPLHADMTAWRRDIHAHPELGFQESRTADRVAALLQACGIEVTRGVGRTGVVGTLKLGSSPRRIGLRADMDALPMQEGNTFAHRSTSPGRMHACGHDGHTAMLMGAAVQLARSKAFDGTVHFIFQPAEEGLGGAPNGVDPARGGRALRGAAAALAEPRLAAPAGSAPRGGERRGGRRGGAAGGRPRPALARRA